MSHWRKFQLAIATLLLVSCAQRELPPTDATLIVRASLVSGGDICDKYCSYRVRIIRTLSGSPNLLPGTLIDVEAYSFGPRIPKGECTLYLRPYSDQLKGLWTIAYADAPHFKQPICYGLSHAEG